MEDVKDQLVEAVAELEQDTSIELTEKRVREIVNEELEAAKPPLKTKKRPFGLSSRTTKS